MWIAPLFLWLGFFNGLIPQEVIQKVEIFRFSDRVITVDGGTGKESVLFYNEKLALIEVGDEVRQGTGAISECRFQDDGCVRFFARARYRVGEQTEKRHVLLVEEFRRLLVKAKTNVVLLLPGGTRLTASFSECYLEREDNRITIRNAGPLDVLLAGHLVDEKERVMPGGHKITIPLYDPELDQERKPIVVREVAGMIVKTTGGYRFEEKPGLLVVSRPLGMEEGLACIGGSRVFLDPGETIIYRLK